MPLQPGDVPDTCANIKNIQAKFDYNPKTSVEEGVSQFVKWYNEYYLK